MSKLEFNTVQEFQSRRESRLDNLTDKRSITPETRKDNQTQFAKSLVIKTDTKTETVAGDKIEWLTDDIYKKIDNSIVDTTKITKTENGYFKKKVVNTDVTTDVGASLFKMPYSNDKQTVFRLGIDAETDEIKKFVKYFNNQKHTLDKTKNPALSNWSKISKKVNDLKSYIKYAKENITKIEKSIVETAKDHLSSETNKTVVIDIFVRNAEGKINLEGGIPETHTVVLYKQSDKYLVIDPSNATFSTILSGIEDIICCFDKNMQIYKPSGKTGQESWRDCIDIAVKLAFAINKTDPDLINGVGNKNYLEAKILKSITAIKIITNQKEQYQDLPKILEKEYVRSKQSSDLQQSELTTLFLKVFNSHNLSIEEKFDTIDAYKLRELLSIQNKKSIENKDNKNHTQYIESLKDYNQTLLNLFSKLDNTEHIASLEEKAIMGELNSDTIGEWNYE